MPHALAEHLDTIPMTPALAATLARTTGYAAAQGHRSVTLEHLLLALTEDEDAQAVFSACNIDLGNLRNDIANYLGQLGDRAPAGEPVNPTPAPELTRILEYAASAARQGRRSFVDGAITLAALIGEGQSMAASFLRAQGLTFDAAVRVLQQQTRTQAPAAAAPAHNTVAPPSTEEILATARERVAASRGQPPRPKLAPTGNTEPPARGPIPGGAAQSQPKPSPPRPASDQPPPPADKERASNTPLSARLEQRAGAGDDLPPVFEAPRRPLGVGSGRAPSPAPSEGAAGDPDVTDLLRPRPENAEPRSEQGLPPPLPSWMKPGAGGAKSGPMPASDNPLAAGGSGHDTESPIGTTLGGSASPTAPRPGAAVQDPSLAAAARSLRPSASPAVEPGQLVENIPRRMRVGSPETVEVRIARHQTTGTMAGLQGRAPPVRHELYITKAMSVRLRAPEGGFKIESASPETQWTEPDMGPLADEFAVWRFLVTPERAGEATLQLIVAARVVGADGLMAETTLPERVFTVRVRTNYLRAAARWSGWIVALAVGGAIGKLGEDGFATLARLIGRWTGS